VKAATLKYPEVIRATSDSSRTAATAWSATFTVEQYYVDNEDISFWTRLYCYQGNCSYPGPTIELVPGDNFTLTIQNKLEANPVGEDTTINSMHSPNTTNLHTHGLHVDPEVDTVFLRAAPGESIVFPYKIPRNHAPGIFWYHDHVHGGSALRVMGGLHGAIVIRPSGEENIPSSITNGDEEILVLSPMNVAQLKDNNGYVSQACSNSATCDPDTQPPDCTLDNYESSTTFNPFRQYTYHELSAATGSYMNASVKLTNKGDSVTSGSWTYYENEIWTTFTNGQFEPEVTKASGQVSTYRIVHAGGGEELDLTFTGNCELNIIAWDGVYLTSPQNKTNQDKIYLMAGSRIDIQMSCTSTGRLKAASQYSSQNILTINIGGSSSYDFTTKAELAAITRPYYLTDLRSATVDVTYANHVSQGNRPTAECGGSDLFWWGAGPDCSDVAPWGSEQPSSTSEDCSFGFFAGERGLDPTTYEDAHKLVTYLGDGSTDGEVNEWSLYGLGNSKHPLHLHVHHMQIIAFECVDGSSNCDISDMEDWMQVGEWRDVFPTFEAKLTVRFRPTDFPGETVLHCHFLRHEDLGMMDTVLVVDGYRDTPSPTLLPTTADTFTLSVSLSLSASLSPTNNDENKLLSLIVNQTDVDESDIYNYNITYSPSNRRRTRHLLSGTWDVSFDITVSLASTGESTQSAYESSINTALTDSTFQTNLVSAISSVTSFDTVTTTLTTRNPSTAPTMVPTSIDDDDSDDKPNPLFLIIGVVAALVLGGIIAFLCCKGGSGGGGNRPTKLDDGEGDVGMKNFTNRNFPTSSS
jgi:FtsP/CotA-like multicopper oxidase with cupredoxin domain